MDKKKYKKGLCTIIVPAYNHEKYVSECLESIYNQTYPSIQLIVINDGSTDKTNQIISDWDDKLKGRFESYIHLSNENMGICKTLNTALEYTEGEFYCVIASDDKMMPKKTELEVNSFNKSKKIGLVYSDMYEIKSDGKFSSKEYITDNLYSKIYDPYKIGNGNVIDRVAKYVFEMPTPTVMIRTELLEQVGNYDESLTCEDPDMFLRIASCSDYLYIDEPLAVHRIHDNNNGKCYDYLKQSVVNMYFKYKNCNWLTKQQKESLCKMLLPFNKFIELPEDKKYIIWGTGGYYQKRKFILDINKVDCFIDSNPKEKVLDGKPICTPDVLSNKEKGKYFIVIASSYENEIGIELEKYGFCKDIDYI